MAERQIHNLGVAGSNPAPATFLRIEIEVEHTRPNGGIHRSQKVLGGIHENAAAAMKKLQDLIANDPVLRALWYLNDERRLS